MLVHPTDSSHTRQIVPSESTKMVVVYVPVIAVSRTSIPGLDAYFLCDEGQKVYFHRAKLYDRSHTVHDVVHDCKCENVLVVKVEFPTSVVEKCVDALYGEDVVYTYPMYNFFKFLGVADDYLFAHNYLDSDQVEVCDDDDHEILTEKAKYHVSTLRDLESQSCNDELRKKIEDILMECIECRIHPIIELMNTTMSSDDKEFLLGKLHSDAIVTVAEFTPLEQREALFDIIERKCAGRIDPEDVYTLEDDTNVNFFVRRGLCPDIFDYVVQCMKQGDVCSRYGATLYRSHGKDDDGNDTISYFISIYNDAYTGGISDADVEYLVERGANVMDTYE